MWDLVPPEPFGAHVQMAIDEVLVEGVAKGARPPTARFWEWSERALVLGSHQSLRNEIDVREAQRHGFSITRRMSGGGTMMVEPGRSITYSLYAPQELVAGLSFVESFAFLDAWLVDALRALGVDASHRPINDIVSPIGKIGGAAQARRRGVVLHHTAMAYSMDLALLPKLIRIGRRRVSRAGIRSAEKQVSPLDRFLTLTQPRLVEALIDAFARTRRTRPASLTSMELTAARELEGRKYAQEAWISRLP